MTLKQTAPSKRVIQQYAEIRYIVAFLGEKAQFDWWKTMTLSSTGEKYHSMLFPRSGSLSTILAVTQAAETHHDGLLGKNRSFHLFRMPTAIEQALHAYYLKGKQAYRNYNQEEALARLTELAGGEQPAGGGPVQVGTHKQIRTTKSIQALAAHYTQAFKTGKVTIPFFADV